MIQVGLDHYSVHPSGKAARCVGIKRIHQRFLADFSGHFRNCCAMTHLACYLSAPGMDIRIIFHVHSLRKYKM